MGGGGFLMQLSGGGSGEDRGGGDIGGSGGGDNGSSGDGGGGGEETGGVVKVSGGGGGEGTSEAHLKEVLLQLTFRDKNILHCNIDLCVGLPRKQFLRSSKPSKFKHWEDTFVKKL